MYLAIINVNFISDEIQTNVCLLNKSLLQMYSNVNTFLDFSEPLTEDRQISGLFQAWDTAFQIQGLFKRPRGGGYQTNFLCSINFPIFNIIKIPMEYRIHIWQVSLQPSCSDTCQIWMWSKKSDRYFRKTEISRMAKLTNGAVVTLNPGASFTNMP